MSSGKPAGGKHRPTPSMQISRTVDKIALEKKRNATLRTQPFKPADLGANVRSFCSNKPGSFLSNRCYKNLLPPIIGVDCFTYENKNAERQGKELLLSLWAKLLECFQANIEKAVLNPANTKIVYDLIWALVSRYEFDLIHIPLPQRGTSATPAAAADDSKEDLITGSGTAAPHSLLRLDAPSLDLSSGTEDMKCVRRYHAYFAQTVRLTLRALGAEAERRLAPTPIPGTGTGGSGLALVGSAAAAVAANAATAQRPNADLASFSTQLLTVCFFKMPILCGALLDAAAPVTKLSIRSPRPYPTDEQSGRATVRVSLDGDTTGGAGLTAADAEEDDADDDDSYSSRSAGGKPKSTPSAAAAKRNAFFQIFEQATRDPSSSTSSTSSSSSAASRKRDGEGGGGDARDRMERRLEQRTQNMYWRKLIKFKTTVLHDLDEFIKKQTNQQKASLMAQQGMTSTKRAGMASNTTSDLKQPLASVPADSTLAAAAAAAASSGAAPAAATSMPPLSVNTAIGTSSQSTPPSPQSVTVTSKASAPPSPSSSFGSTTSALPASGSTTPRGGSDSTSSTGGGGGTSTPISGSVSSSRCPNFLINNPSLFDWNMFREPDPVLPPGIAPAPTTPPLSKADSSSALLADAKMKDKYSSAPLASRSGAFPSAAVARNGNANAAQPPGSAVTSVFNSNELLSGSLASPATMYLLKVKFADPADFFELLHAYLSHVESSIHGGDIVWGLVPGYWILVQSFVRRVLDMTASEYPHSLISCFRLLLHNPDLLTFMTRAVLGTTPSNDRLSINRALDLHDAWFRAVGSVPGERADDEVVKTRLQYSLCAALPHTFCFDFYLQSLSILVRSEHYQTLLKALTFLYTHIGHHYHRERIVLVERTVFANFYRLFLHWCPEIRKVFHYILIFKLKRFYAPPKPAQPKPAAGSTTPVAGASTGGSGGAPNLDRAASSKPAVGAPPLATGSLAKRSSQSATTPTPTTPTSAAAAAAAAGTTGSAGSAGSAGSPTAADAKSKPTLPGTPGSSVSSGSTTPRSGAKPEDATATAANGTGTPGASGSAAPPAGSSASTPLTELSTEVVSDDAFEVPSRSLPRSRSLTREMLGGPVRGGLGGGSGGSSLINVKDPQILLKRINEMNAKEAADKDAASKTGDKKSDSPTASAAPGTAAGGATAASPKRQLKESPDGKDSKSAAGSAAGAAPVVGTPKQQAAAADVERAPSAPAIGKEPVPAQPTGLFARFKSLFSKSSTPAAAAAGTDAAASGAAATGSSTAAAPAGSSTAATAVAPVDPEKAAIDVLSKQLEDEFGACHTSRTFTNKSELEADLKFCQRADVFIRSIRQQVRDPVAVKHFSRQLLVYAAPALFEFDSHYELFQRLQLAKSAETERIRVHANKAKEKDVWRIYCPELCFDIEAAGLAS